MFSARKGTPAANYQDNTAFTEKKERLQRLNTIINAGYKRGHDRFKGKTVEVLVEGVSKKDDHIMAGYTRHNKLVNFPGDVSLVGTLLNVKVNETKTWFMQGEIYEDA